MTFHPVQTRIALAALLAAVIPFGISAEPSGEQIYQDQCLRCHGPDGEGDEKRYPEPLIGDRSVAQLTRYIAESMPEQKPALCVGEDARAVAEYIHGAFYSPAAQARNRPPRIELARLTNRQYRNAVADLIGSFRNASPVAQGGDGLRGEYFRSRRFRDRERAIDRTDPVIDFDFGEDSPAPGELPEDEFAVRWQGSVFARETGRYEFILQSENGARLWVNDRNEPLIDAWVQSGDGERRGSITLLGGRSYPLRLEMFKSKQGKEKSASISLSWEPPGGVKELVPTRCLSPESPAETFVLTTPFPPDDRSRGWVRGTAVSAAWENAVTEAAIETAGYVVDNLRDLGVRDEAKAKEFCTTFVERAFRRPLPEEQRRAYVDDQFGAAPDTEAAVKGVVLRTLLSPRFLYREVGGPDAYDVASRLSFGLWDSIPDRELTEAARLGRLETAEQVTGQAERMLNDPRARSKLGEFFHHWLKMDHAPDVSKDPGRFPDFGPEIVADLRTSLELFLDEVAWGDDPDFRRLLLADHLYLNRRLAEFYGEEPPADAGFARLTPTTGKRAGVLTHPYLMAGFAYTADTSPIHRGVFVARGILGVGLRPPPEAFTPLAADLHPDLTTRERVTLQTMPATCMNCHGVINPLGFPLENFDAIGRFRETDNGKPIDASGLYETRSGEVVRFDGARDLAEYLAVSTDVHESFVEQMFHHLVQQPVLAYGAGTMNDLRDSFTGNGFNMRKLAVEIMATSALTPRKTE